MNLEKLSFSIVICTYNRDEFLERSLKSLSHIQYKNFEVVVVNGPSTDRTREILDGYKGKIKIENNAFANLSISRNLGIAAASGDVVAFLDDDAIPEPDWLHQIAEVYEKNGERIGGAGGRVYGPGGDHFQFHNGNIDIWGEAEVKLPEPGPYTNPTGPKFNIMMGVNSTFLRKSLLAVGGFDEYYEYFHDESDLCLRLGRAGFPIYHHNEAYVHHEFARSHIRKSSYHLNWYPIVKNTVYFGVKNSKGLAGILKRVFLPFFVARKRVVEFRHWKRNGNITKNDYKSFMKMWWKGVSRGYIDGFSSSRRLRFDMEPKSPFLVYQKEELYEIDPAIRKDEVSNNEKPEKWGICLLSRYYPPYGSGGVGTYTKALAECLVLNGYNVYVITSNVPSGSEYINGVHIIGVGEVPLYTEFNDFKEMNVVSYNVRYSNKVSEIVEDLWKQGKVQIVESPLWDYEGLALTQINGPKVFVRLETPLRKAAAVQNWSWNMDLELSAQLEKKFIRNADGIITISKDVKHTIGQMYDIDWSSYSVDLVPLGLFKQEELIEPNYQPEQRDTVRILFVGRLELRKGIDVLLKAFSDVAKRFPHVQLDVIGNDTIPFKQDKTFKDGFLDEKPYGWERVHFLGEVNDQKLQEYYSQCDFFVAPSRYESFGLVYLEAMRYGKAVIGSKIGGIPEVVEDGVTGLLVSPDDVNELSTAIEKLITEVQLRIGLGKKGFHRLKTLFTTEIMTGKTINVYTKRESK